jgi:hypothetical protein
MQAFCGLSLDLYVTFVMVPVVSLSLDNVIQLRPEESTYSSPLSGNPQRGFLRKIQKMNPPQGLGTNP